MTDADTITVIYFAWVRELTGIDSEAIALPGEGVTGAQLLARLCETYPGLKDRADRLHIAINQEHADPQTLLKPGDEVAFFPPVTGG